MTPFFSDTNGPWLLRACKPITRQNVSEDILLLELDGSVMSTLDEMYQEFSSVLQFPDYFGNNFNALEECLTDLEWLSATGYLLIFKNAEHLLEKEQDDVLEGFLSILSEAGEEWARPVRQGEAWDRDGMPFHTVLMFDKNNSSAFSHRLKNIGLEVKEL